MGGGGLLTPRSDGEDVGDHPPITPVKLATAKQCGESWPVYQLICRQFVSSLSSDCILEEASVTVAVRRGSSSADGEDGGVVGGAYGEDGLGDGPEMFTGSAMRMVNKGWMAVLGVHVFGGANPEQESANEATQDELYGSIAYMTVGQMVPLKAPPAIEKKFTQPPPYLSEGELLGEVHVQADGGLTPTPLPYSQPSAVPHY